MSAAGAFRLRLTEACSFGERRLLVGNEIDVDAATAAEWIRAGRARLVNPSDLQRLVGMLQDTAGGRWPLSATTRGSA